MVDREKVLHGLNSCGYCDGIPNVCGVTECPYESDSPWCTHYLAHDAGELIGYLLKEQEPVKPNWLNGIPYCGNCNCVRLEWIVVPDYYCRKCGRKVKWK